MHDTDANKLIVRNAFEAWASGEGSFVDIMDRDVVWTISGSGRSARTFRSKQAFVDAGCGPVAAVFATPMRPEVVGIYVDGGMVVVRWDGEAGMRDGQTYRNSYTWFFEMSHAKVVRATAFLDLPTYDAAIEGRELPRRHRARRQTTTGETP